MPKLSKALKPLEVSRLNRPGLHAVGTVTGLCLKISPSQSKSWVYRRRFGKSSINLGLGGYPSVSLKDAIDKARVAQAQFESGVNPVTHKKQVKVNFALQSAKSKTFKWCAEQYMSQLVFTNEKHQKQWPSTLNTYAYPVIGNVNVSDIELTHIKEILDPIWKTKNTTADRLLGRIRAVIDYAIVCGYRDKANPANWKGYLERIYPSSNKVHKVTHIPSLHYSKIYEFILELKKIDSMSARCLEFLIHTCVRSGSARAATWNQFNFKENIWTIPKEQTKTKKKAHRVPLTKQVLMLLDSLPRYEGTNLVFPSPTMKILSDSTLSKLMRNMLTDGSLKDDAKPHGFRASFRTWVLEETNHNNELGEISLMHAVGDSVYQAYQRGDGINKRINIMQDWSNYISSPNLRQNNVIPIKKKVIGKR